MAVGPPGFTSFGEPAFSASLIVADHACQIAFMNLANSARTAFPAAGLLDEEAARIFQVISIWYSLPLLGLALYLWITPLVLYIIGIIKIRKFRWTMSFWSLTFPCELHAMRFAVQALAKYNLATGMFMASAQLGEQLPSKTFKSVAN
jgi:hypothetical protein